MASQEIFTRFERMKFMQLSNHDRMGNSPMKNAWVQLQIIKPIKMHFATGKDPSEFGSNTGYNEFKKALQKAEVVNPNNVGTVPKPVLAQVNLSMNYSGRVGFYSKVEDILEKAYGLGMVDDKGRLLQAYDTSI